MTWEKKIDDCRLLGKKGSTLQSGSNFDSFVVYLVFAKTLLKKMQKDSIKIILQTKSHSP